MENDKIDLRKYIVALKRGWIWGLIVFILIMSLAITYCIIKMPQYDSYAMMLIEDDSDKGSRVMGGGMASLMRTFSIGGFGSSSIDNELVIVKSNAVKKAVSSRLGLNRTYVEKKGLKKEFLYKNSPVLVEAPNQLFDTLQTSFKIRVEMKGNKVDISVSKGRFRGSLASKECTELPCSFETPYGTFQIIKTDFYKSGENRTIDVMISGDDIIAAGLDEDVLSVDYRNKKADIVELKILDVSKERGQDILNALMSLYNEKRKGRRNETATAEVEFLDERIAQLGVQLNVAENKVASFKSGNNLIDIGTEASLLIHQNKRTDEEIISMNIQRSMLNDILEQLNNPEKKYSLIPMAETLGDGGAASVIGNYNALILKRLDVSKSAKSDNVVLKSLTDQIDALRETAIENVNRTLDNLQIKYSSASKENSKYKGRLNTLPKYEQEYVDLMRDKELKNALYMFLLEKRESAMLKLNNTQELGFIFEPAYSAIKTNKFKIYMILGIGFSFGLMLGFIFSIIKGMKKYNK